MNQALAAATQWMVSARADGEILTAGAGSDGLEFCVVGFPDRFTPEEIAGWVNDLTGVARETATGDTRARTIPPLLHHALTGLLFSHAELWESDGITRPCSAAFVVADGRVAFGWVGEALSEVWVDDGPLEDVYTRVRDDEGREALGIAFDPGCRVRVRLTWTALPGATHAPSAVIEAEWAGATPAFEARVTGAPVAARADSAGEEVEIVSVVARSTAPEAQARQDVEHAAAAEPEFAGSTAAEPAASSPSVEMAPSDMAPASRVVEEATAAIELPGTARAKRGLLGRISSWLRRPKVAGSAGEAAEPGEPPHDASPVRSAAAAPDIAEAEARVPDPAAHPSTPRLEPATGTHEDLFPVSPAPPALARLDVEIEDPHVRVLGPVAADRTPPLLHVPRFEDPTVAGPPRLRVVRVGEESGEWDASPPSPGVPAPAARGPVAIPVAPAPGRAPVHDPSTPAPGPGPIPAAPAADWEPPPSMIADPLADSFEEEALAAALAALAAEVQSDAPPPAVEDAMPAAAVPPAAPAALPSSQSMRAALSARALARSAPVPEARAEAGPLVVQPPPSAEPIPVTVVRAREEAQDTPVPPPAEAPNAPAAESPPSRVPLRPEWPSAAQQMASVPVWKKPWTWVAVVVALFLGGWIVGGLQRDPGQAPRRSPLAALVRGLGLGGARFDVMVNSRPSGAWIAVDGKDLARRTPASIDLPPGEHAITLSITELGSATFKVRGERGERVALDAPLWGTIDVYAANGAPPVTVTFDGRDVGFAPVSLDSVQPGAHDLRFSGPGMPAWGQPVELHVGQRAEVVARPMTSPATGMLEVRASITDDQGTRALAGAAVFVDGEPSGSTPLTLELPRGPHSVRITYRDQTAPVQVIDLPGGNQRFAQFELALGVDRPHLVALESPTRFAAGGTGVVSAGLDGVSANDVREMWLHVRTPEGAWRRYQMAMLKSPTGVVGVVVFPSNLFTPGTRARWYASATVSTGDEYFTEIGNADIGEVAPRRRAPAGAAVTP